MDGGNRVTETERNGMRPPSRLVPSLLRALLQLQLKPRGRLDEGPTPVPTAPLPCSLLLRLAAWFAAH